MNERFQVVRSVLLAAIAVVLVVNIVLLFQLSAQLKGTGNAGTLRITFLTAPNCKDCFDLGPLHDYLTQNGIKDSQISQVPYTSLQGWWLTYLYGITKVPTAVFSGDYNSYGFLQQLKDNIGEVRKDAFVITKVQPPYEDLSQHKERGQFDVIYLVDKSCKDCYDVTLNKQVFDRLVMHPAQERTVDISDEEGKALIDAYQIKAVPTILLRGDLDAYDSLQQIWTKVGTKEQDGTYVLRDGVASMGTYKQLPEGTIIQQTAPSQTPSSPQS